MKREQSAVAHVDKETYTRTPNALYEAKIGLYGHCVQRMALMRGVHNWKSFGVTAL